MIVYIYFVVIVAILSFVIGISAANLFFWFASYAISSFFASFVEKNRKITQGLIQTILLFTITLFLFVYSYRNFTYINTFGEGSNGGVIGKWFLLLTGLVSGFLTLAAFILSFDNAEKQKTLGAEKAA